MKTPTLRRRVGEAPLRLDRGKYPASTDDAWAEASIRQLATWRMCRDCRHALVSAIETGTAPGLAQ